MEARRHRQKRDRSIGAELRQGSGPIEGTARRPATAMLGETERMSGRGYSFLRFSNVLYGTGAIPSRVRCAAQNQRALDWIAPVPSSLLTKAKERKTKSGLDRPGLLMEAASVSDRNGAFAST